MIDGDLIPQPLPDPSASGAGDDKPLLLGCTKHEFIAPLTSHLRLRPDTDPLTALQAAGIPPRTVGAATAAPDAGDGVEWAARIISDLLCRAPSWRRAHQRAGTGAATWLYRFAWVSPALGDAGHCLDVPFFFDCLTSERVADVAGENPPASLARDVQARPSRSSAVRTRLAQLHHRLAGRARVRRSMRNRLEQHHQRALNPGVSKRRGR